jgi:hypothetical protein
MPSWIEITTWAFAALGFLNTLRTLIAHHAPNTRVGKWFRTPPAPPAPNPEPPEWRLLMERRLNMTEKILEELQRQNSLPQESIQAVVTFSPQPHRPGLRKRANSAAEGSRGQAQ